MCRSSDNRHTHPHPHPITSLLGHTLSVWSAQTYYQIHSTIYTIYPGHCSDDTFRVSSSHNQQTVEEDPTATELTYVTFSSHSLTRKMSMTATHRALISRACSFSIIAYLDTNTSSINLPRVRGYRHRRRGTGGFHDWWCSWSCPPQTWSPIRSTHTYTIPLLTCKNSKGFQTCSHLNISPHTNAHTDTHTTKESSSWQPSVMD